MKDRNAYFELLVYLVSSAERITGEPESYAPLRLIDAAQRLCRIMIAEGDANGQHLDELAQLIEDGRQNNMSETEAFQQMLTMASEKLMDCM